MDPLRRRRRATCPPYAEVDKVDSRAKRPTALAYARNIDVGSLRIDKNSVEWLQAGAIRSAPLR